MESVIKSRIFIEVLTYSGKNNYRNTNGNCFLKCVLLLFLNILHDAYSEIALFTYNFAIHIVRSVLHKIFCSTLTDK